MKAQWGALVSAHGERESIERIFLLVLCPKRIRPRTAAVASISCFSGCNHMSGTWYIFLTTRPYGISYLPTNSCFVHVNFSPESETQCHEKPFRIYSCLILWAWQDESQDAPFFPAVHKMFRWKPGIQMKNMATPFSNFRCWKKPILKYSKSKRTYPNASLP